MAVSARYVDEPKWPTNEQSREQIIVAATSTNRHEDLLALIELPIFRSTKHNDVTG